MNINDYFYNILRDNCSLLKYIYILKKEINGCFIRHLIIID